MYQVYKYALLNIAADDAVDAREGFFRPRHPMAIDPLELHMPGLGGNWYATVDERNMFERVSEAPLSKRAWVFQERHLA